MSDPGDDKPKSNSDLKKLHARHRQEAKERMAGMPAEMVEEILKKMNYFDLFEYSTESPENQAMIKNSPALALPDTMKINFESSGKETAMSLVVDGKVVNKWKIDIGGGTEDFPEFAEDERSFVLNGEKMVVVFDEDSEVKDELTICYMIENGDENTARHIHGIVAVLKHFKETFDCKFGDIIISLFASKLEMCKPLIEIFEKCENLNYIVRDPSRLHPKENIDYLLNAIEVSGKFKKTDKGGSDSLEFRGAGQWKDFLQKTGCRSIEVTDKTLDLSHLEEFLRFWKQSEGSRELSYIKVKIGFIEDDVDLDPLNLMKFDKEKRGRYFKINNKIVDANEFLDIERADGLLASFFIRDESFIFYIWHERFPVFTLKELVMGGMWEDEWEEQVEAEMESWGLEMEENEDEEERIIIRREESSSEDDDSSGDEFPFEEPSDTNSDDN